MKLAELTVHLANSVEFWGQQAGKVVRRLAINPRCLEWDQAFILPGAVEIIESVPTSAVKP